MSLFRNSNQWSFAKQIGIMPGNARRRNLIYWSAGLLAVLFSIAASSMLKADQTTFSSSTDNPQESFKAETIVENSLTPVGDVLSEDESNVEVKAQTSVHSNSGSQVNVNGSVTTTDSSGEKKTETFSRTYEGSEGNASNSMSINVDTSTSSDTDVRIRERGDSDVDIDIKGSTEVNM